MSDLLKSQNRFEAQGIVFALGVHFAYVKLFDPVAKPLQNERGLAHRRVYLADVSNVEAERSLR